MIPGANPLKPAASMLLSPSDVMDQLWGDYGDWGELTIVLAEGKCGIPK